ncbi:MAG TPA: hypothetical protein VGJ20_09335 [Xanthobacteraceae bacterium]|jgi:hypothetical protein
MAKKKKGARGKFGEAMKALEDAGVPNQEFGRLHREGAHIIDSEKLEALKRKVGKAAWSKVRFVALNAPFKRRSPIPPA